MTPFTPHSKQSAQTPVHLNAKIMAKVNNAPTTVKNFDLMNLISTQTYFGLKTKNMEKHTTEVVQGLMFQEDELVITWRAPSNMVLLYLIERSLELYVETLNNYKMR